MSAERTITIGETSAGPCAGDFPAGQPVELPVEEILQGRGFVTGKSGSGKSNAVAVVVEELLKANFPVLIFDADGEYVSLKEEYEILHVGGDEFCERVVGPEHADALAQLGIEEREPIILDLGGYAEDETDATGDEVTRDEMVRAVTSAFFNRASKAKREWGGAPYLLVAEEIHEYVPQQSGVSQGGAKLVKVAKRGRKKGLGVVGISQRPAAVDKDFITQCDWIVWNRLTWDNDTAVAGRILGNEYKDAIEGLAAGEAFLQTDWDERVRRVQFRRRRTTDLGEAPGLDGAAEMELKETDTSVLDELDSAAAQARTKQQQIDRLREQLEEVRDERDEWAQKFEDAEYISEINAEVSAAQFEDLFSGVGIEGAELSVETATVEINGDPIEVPEVIKADVLEIREKKRELEDELAEKNSRIADQEATIEDLREELEERAAAGDLEALREDVIELLQRHPKTLDIESGGRVAKVERELQQVKRERDELEKQVSEEFGDVDELLAHETVQARVDEVADDSAYSDEHTWDAVTALAGTEWVGIDAVTPYMGIGEKSTGDVLRNLAEAGLVEKQTQGNRLEYRLDREALQSLVDAYRKRERVKAKREEINGNSKEETDD